MKVSTKMVKIPYVIDLYQILYLKFNNFKLELLTEITEDCRYFKRRFNN